MSRISRAERTRWDKLTVFYFSTKSNQPFSSSSDSSFAGLFLSSVTSFLSPPAVGSVDERKFSTSKSTQASTLEEARAHTELNVSTHTITQRSSYAQKSAVTKQCTQGYLWPRNAGRTHARKFTVTQRSAHARKIDLFTQVEGYCAVFPPAA